MEAGRPGMAAATAARSWPRSARRWGGQVDLVVRFGVFPEGSEVVDGYSGVGGTVRDGAITVSQRRAMGGAENPSVQRHAVRVWHDRLTVPSTGATYSADSAIAGSTRAARRAGTQHATAATTKSTSGTDTNVVRSAAGTPNSWRSISARRRTPPPAPARCPPRRSGARGPGPDAPPPPGRAQRHPDPDLPRPLRHHVRHHPVHADQRQQQPRHSW